MNKVTIETIGEFPEEYIFNLFSVELPKGKYYITDPSLFYNTNDENWSNLIDHLAEDSEEFTRPFCGGRINDKDVLFFNFPDGDGVYSDNFGNSYSIDSGSLAFIPTTDETHRDTFVMIDCQDDNRIISFDENVNELKIFNLMIIKTETP